MESMKKLTNIGFYFVFGLAAFNWLGWPIQIRFSEAHLNYYFITLLCVLLPIALFFKILIFGNRLNYIAALLSSTVLGLVCFIVGTFAFSDAVEISESRIDLSFEHVQEINFKETYYRLYRTNGGATTSFGLVLRAESRDFFGVKVVNEVFSKYQASEAEMTVVGDSIELKIQPYSQHDDLETVLIKI